MRQSHVIVMRVQNSREDKSISVQPLRIFRVEVHELVEENVGGRSQAHGCTGMTGIRFWRGIDLTEWTFISYKPYQLRLVVLEMVSHWNTKIITHHKRLFLSKYQLRQTDEKTLRIGEIWSKTLRRIAYSKNTDRADGQLVDFRVAHDYEICSPTSLGRHQ